MDDTIIFRHLTKRISSWSSITNSPKFRERLKERGFDLILTEEAKEFLISKGSNLDYGVSSASSCYRERIEDPLAEELLRGAFEGKNTIVVGAIKDDEGKVARLDFQGEARDVPGEVVAASTTTN